MAERESRIEGGNDRPTGQAREAEASRGGGIIGIILLPIAAVGTMIGKAWDAITSDGMLAAAGRQGLDELGAALKPFPDSIQVHETGTIWNPTPGEVAASRDLGGHGRSSYSSLTPPRSAEAAEHNRHQPGNEHGQDQGLSM
jgi:hypothetical protein